MKTELENNNIIKEKLSKLFNFKRFTKEFCIRNLNLHLKKEALYNKLLDEYGEIQFNLSSIGKETIINNYKNSRGLEEEEMEKLILMIYLILKY